MLSLLKSKCNVVTVLDPADPEIDQTKFLTEHWYVTPYETWKECIDSNEPKPRGIGFTMRVFVESDNAGDSVARLSKNGFIAPLNKAPIFVYYKK